MVANKNKSIFGLIAVVISAASGNVTALNLSGLQDCQAIKSQSKKLECFDRETLKLIQDQRAQREREEAEKVAAEKASSDAKKKAEEARMAAEIAAIESKKKSDEAKLLAEMKSQEKAKIDNAQKILQIVKRVQNRIQTGVVFRDYSALISDPKFEVENYSREAPDDLKAFSLQLVSAMILYDHAGTIWNLTFNGHWGRKVTRVTCTPEQERYIETVLEVIRVRKDSDLNAYCSGYVILEAVREAWGLASREIRYAENLLSQRQQSLKPTE
jgi:hypothetical protein